METQQLTFEQQMEIRKILSQLSDTDKETVLNYITNLNNAVQDYESRIRNAMSNLK